MGVLAEFLIISATAFAGSLIALIPGFPFPGTVTGMVLMLLLLASGLVKLKYIQRAADFFLGYLTLFFVPLFVNLVKEAEILNKYGVRLVIVILLTSLITMAATGLTARLLLSFLHTGDKKND